MVRIVLAAVLAPAAQVAAAQVPPDALKELAPAGKLRAAINYGNGVLAQKGPDGEPRGVSADRSRELARRPTRSSAATNRTPGSHRQEDR